MANLSIKVDGTIMDVRASEGASLMNAIIPDVIQRRTGKLPSLRRILTPAFSQKEPRRPLPSPPPPYAEQRGFEMDSPDEACEIKEARGRQNALRSSSTIIFQVANENTSSGIRWKHVGEGCRLIECAGREAADVNEDPELARKMFIDGTGYLLKALPDLSPNEAAQLANYMPSSLRPAEDHRSPDQRLQRQAGDEHSDQSNYIYHAVALATMYAVLLASFLLPLLERFAVAVYRCDQRYHVSARVAETTTQTAASVARRVFASLNEGRLGQVALGVTLYTVANASRGVSDGYAQAVRRQSAGGRVEDARLEG